MKVDFYLHNLNAADAAGVAAVLDTPFLTSGAVGRAVEDQLREYFALPHACLTNSWTNGALAALLAIGLAPGDEVIVPAMTFIATANVVELLGGRVVFVDVDPETLLLTPDAVAAALTPRTRAVMPVHLYGQMCDMQGIRAVLDGHSDVWLIEDAAHCFEGTRDGFRPGAFSDAAIFSFYGTKNVTCGEGGAVVSRHDGFFERFLKARLHGMSLPAVDRFRGGRYVHWDMEMLGCKANLPDLLAALLPDQIRQVDARLDGRRRLAGRYRDAFAATPLRLQKQAVCCISAEHLFPVNLPATVRDAAIGILNEADIGCTVNYVAPHETHYYSTAYQHAAEDFPVASAWGRGTLSLPLYNRLTDAQQDHVIGTMLGRVLPLCEQVPA